MQADGRLRPMTCSLTTFLMAFAKTEFRETVRKAKEDFFDELCGSQAIDRLQATAAEGTEDEEETKNRIVDECINAMSPTCVEILTLFYFKGMTLDEIIRHRGDKNNSKNGLKTSKNKCMNTLRKNVAEEFAKLNLTA